MVPANGEAAAYTDTTLSLTFDAAPTVGTSGYIKVYKASDNSLVDIVSLNVFNTGSWANNPIVATPDITATTLSSALGTATAQTAIPNNNTEIDRLGGGVTTISSSGVELYRWVFYTPITISGNTATIKLHDGKLSGSTAYYVTIDNGVLNGTIGGTAFAGISSPTTWTFTTKANPTSQTDVTVNYTGTSADFRTVQGALNWIMNNCGGTSTNSCNSSSVTKTITIKNGTYNGMLFLRGVNNIVLQGESRAGAIVQFENFEQYNPGSGGSATLATVTGTNLTSSKAQSEIGGYRQYLGGGRPVLLIEGADLVKLTNFTLQNTHVKTTTVNNQAETLYYNSATLNGSRFTASYMNFISAQDTIQTKGWVWYYQSYIAGDVDFIWGSPFAAVFEQSDLHTVADPTNSTSGGYIVQSRAVDGFPGFVFINSTLTSDAAVPGGATYLARSAGYNVPAGKTGYCTTVYTSGSLGNANLYCDNVAYINTKMGPHIATVGWYTNPVPSFTPSSTQGWRESGSMDPTGATLSMAGRDTTYATSTADLSAINSSAKVFSIWNSNAGWTPTP